MPKKGKPYSFVTVTCPYCGMETRLFRPLSPAQAHEIIFCDCEVGGCDRPFVVFYHAEINLDRVSALADELPPPAPPAPPDSPAPVSEFLADDVTEAKALLAQFEEQAGATDGEHSALDLLPHDARLTLAALGKRLERAANVVAGHPVAALPCAASHDLAEPDAFFLLDPIAGARRTRRAVYVA